MADVTPFRAVRYDPGQAGPLARLVAPPYDVIGEEQRDRLLAQSPYNVVHLTLPDDEAEAARLWRQWLDDGMLVRDGEPALWWLVQDYVGPDGLARSRAGLVCSLRAEPYEARVVLPHERTHAGPKEGRLRLLRALRAQVEPIFLLYDGELAGPVGEPLLEVELEGVRNRLWRLEGAVPAELAGAQLLIADGHHRYETTLAFHDEEGSPASARLMVVVVPTRQEGLTIFPTHRLAGTVRLPAAAGGSDDPLDLLGRLESAPRGRAAVVVYRPGGAVLLEGEPGELDAELVERSVEGPLRYTPFAREAVAAVDRGEAEAAFLLRPPTIEEVRAVAQRGDVMPQKSTYFFPKLPSGLLFHPL